MEDSELRFDEDYFHWIRIVLTNNFIKVGVFIENQKYFVNSSSCKWERTYIFLTLFVGKFRNEP